MRLFEFLSPDELQQLELLIYKNVYKALATYQQQRATQQRIATKPAAALKPQAAKKIKALARKAKQPPHAAAPKPLPKPNPLPKTNTSTKSAYSPIKTAKPLPPTTRMAVANSKPRTTQPESTPSASRPIMNLGHLDQAARRMLPPDRRGPNPIDLINR